MGFTHYFTFLISQPTLSKYLHLSQTPSMPTLGLIPIRKKINWTEKVMGEKCQNRKDYEWVYKLWNSNLFTFIFFFVKRGTKNIFFITNIFSNASFLERGFWGFQKHIWMQMRSKTQEQSTSLLNTVRLQFFQDLSL